MILYTLASAKE